MSKKREQIAKAFADLIQKEIRDICPEESMNRMLFLHMKNDSDVFENDETITGCKFLDGKIYLEVETQGEKYDLELTPTNWTKHV